ncbi:hypothetical protein CLV62_12549 [Dysgonomonas alginatilytica]|uniref:Uncharacterized protein n=1 Tax=Dysgonomonas alginatilytica TaxID=1605892 RepID=A0A2V3PLY6_9BACT|nr:hypothetical protein [Dysgonomonas alginatilytica]PXV61216.1 hypothetical protein CLV62_12549 [Dysgonomonas alginatilytica]
MIANSQNEALLILANSTKEKVEWAEYANYCSDREKGLRKTAFEHLNTFIKDAQKWVLTQRIEFVSYIFPYFETVQDADYGGFPQPLSEKVIKPTLEEWCALENEDNRPFRWYGKYYKSEDHLFKALELNPLDDMARSTIISWWSYQIYYSVHHLPDYYIGDPYEDILLSNKIKEQINLLNDGKVKLRLEKALEEDLELVRNYIEWKELGHLDFDKWGEENQKSTGYGLTRTYYYTK